MKFLRFHELILFLISKFIGIASGLECYQCSSGYRYINCTADEASMNVNNCSDDRPGSGRKAACEIVFSTEANPPYTMRTCGYALETDVEDDLFCDKEGCQCLSNKCNGFALDTLAKTTGRVKKSSSSSINDNMSLLPLSGIYTFCNLHLLTIFYSCFQIGCRI